MVAIKATMRRKTNAVPYCTRSVNSFWGIFELSGLDAAAEQARQRLHEHLEKLDAAARRFEERLASSNVPRLGPAR